MAFISGSRILAAISMTSSQTLTNFGRKCGWWSKNILVVRSRLSPTWLYPLVEPLASHQIYRSWRVWFSSWLPRWTSLKRGIRREISQPVVVRVSMVDMVHHSTEVIDREVEVEDSSLIDVNRISAMMIIIMMTTMMGTMMTSTTTNPVLYVTGADKRDTWPLDVVSSWITDGSH